MGNPTEIIDCTAVSALEEGRIRLYQSTLDLLAKEVLAVVQRRADDVLSRESYDFLMAWNRDAKSPSSIARQIVRGYDSTRKLAQIISRMGIRDEKRIWKSVEEDNIYVVHLLKSLCASPSGQEALISLGRNSTYSESFLSLVDEIEKDPRYWNAMCGCAPNERPTTDQDEQGNITMRELILLSINVSQTSDQLPKSIFISGVKLKDKNPVRGGAFADIFHGQYMGKLVAVKKLRVFMQEREELRDKTSRAFCREALTWKLLKHPHVLEFYGVSRELFTRTFCMVSPWLSHGNVNQYIKNVGFIANDVYRLLTEVASGLEYLHSHSAQIVHGDLRGPNILIDDERHARLSDFGLSNFEGSYFTGSSRAANTTWTPPEGIDPQAFGLSSARPIPAGDIFAFAGICWEVHNGRPPFADLRHAHAITSIARGERPFRESCRLSIPTDLWALMTKCWAHDYRSRPTAWEVLTACQSIQRTAPGAAPPSGGDGSHTSNSPQNSDSSLVHPVPVPRPIVSAADYPSARRELPKASPSSVQTLKKRQSSSRLLPILEAFYLQYLSFRGSFKTSTQAWSEYPTTPRTRIDGPIAMPEPWSGISYDIRETPSRQQQVEHHVTFLLPDVSSSQTETQSRTESSADFLSGTEDTDETATASDDAAIIPSLNHRLSRLNLSNASPSRRNTQRSRRPSRPTDSEYPPVPIAPSPSEQVQDTGAPQSLRRTPSFPTMTYVYPPIIIPLPMGQPMMVPQVPACNGSCIYYSSVMCPLHNTGGSATDMMNPYMPPYM
ncbi:hypothetical protein NM688_g543 [Phlebia brevispora]|uniref:Uncharacterized protein n=1 Tax=Phlebia brevispora TaxID=194682 RepID=A0ACC1TE19_9APHY|nr:hypothetical protein NM688_g543 [Phlebia brevispora]